jgi:hypothetical protein
MNVPLSFHDAVVEFPAVRSDALPGVVPDSVGITCEARS